MKRITLVLIVVAAILAVGCLNNKGSEPVLRCYDKGIFHLETTVAKNWEYIEIRDARIQPTKAHGAPLGDKIKIEYLDSRGNYLGELVLASEKIFIVQNDPLKPERALLSLDLTGLPENNMPRETRYLSFKIKAQDEWESWRFTYPKLGIEGNQLDLKAIEDSICRLFE